MKTTTTYTPEFKAEAVKLVTEQGLSHQEAAGKLGIPTGTLSSWISQRRRHNPRGAPPHRVNSPASNSKLK